MKKKKLLLGLSLLLIILFVSCRSARSGTGQAPTVAVVPDPNFRTFLLAHGWVKPYNKNHPQKGTVQVTPKGVALTSLVCYQKEIQSLEGISLFPNLETLVCSQNPIRHLDLSGNPRLSCLAAVETPLKTLDISHNPQLRTLELSYTQLRHLDLSHNPLLEEMLCIFSPRIDHLDFSHNPNLRTLYVRATNLSFLDLRSNPEVRTIHALDTPLQYIALSPHHNLDSTMASVEKWVRLELLDPLAPLPAIDKNAHYINFDTIN